MPPAPTAAIPGAGGPLNRLQAVWYGVRDSLWFVPAIATVLAIGLALSTVEFDRRFIDPEDARDYFFVFGAGAEGARGVLSAVAQSIMTVTGVVFSVTIIALQLASTQYSPRVLHGFMDDRANQLVLGTFIGTFVYALLVLRFVRSDDEYVPSLSVTLAVGLALLSVGALIFFINHIANSLKVETIAARTTGETLRIIERLFPSDSAESRDWDPEVDAPLAGETTETAGEPGTIQATSSGYIQAMDLESLEDDVAPDVVLRLDRQVGDFVIHDEPLAFVWPADRADDEKLAATVRRAYTIGDERTHYQDLERGLVELVDMAVKALSPAVYEPTTVRVCLDRITELLVAIGRRAPTSRFHARAGGRVQVVTRYNQFESAVRQTIRPIRRYGESQAVVLIWILEYLARIADLVPPIHREPLRTEARETLARGEATIESSIDLEGLRRSAERTLEVLGG
jgi:uncharacterized membrane protein